jgi:hypothetical protein
MEIIARLAADETPGDRIIKVNHAGEHGAVNIYRAQLLACRWRRSVAGVGGDRGGIATPLRLATSFGRSCRATTFGRRQ